MLAMTSITANRCFNHAHREAVALCTTCGRHYCRECITEHGGRIICSFCLEQREAKRAARQGMLAMPFKAVSLAGGLLLLWIFFYYLGRILLALPSSFHEGTIWKVF
jgi:hypothetical protein